MCKAQVRTLLLLTICYVCRGATPPRVEKPNLLDSYVPACMQIIAHLTDLMKYELRPGGTTTTTTTIRPTPSHKPGVYAPDVPPGPEAYFAKRNNDLSQGLSSSSYFDRYRFALNEEEKGRAAEWTPTLKELKTLEQIFSQLGFYKSDEGRQLKSLTDTSALSDLELLGDNLQYLYHEANKIDEDSNLSEDEKTENFVKKFDDSSFSLNLLRQKRIPPTRAYVSLLSLYDAMNKDSKKLGLNKYNGYTDGVLKVLIATSDGTSAEQLKTVFTKIVQRKDTSDDDVLKRINLMLTDMGTDKSYLNDALRYIPPLQFVK